MSVSSGNDKRQGRKPDLVVSLLAFFEKHCVNVTFEVIHRNQRLIESERQTFRVADAYQQSSCETGTMRDRNSVDRVIAALSIVQSLPDHRHNSAQMLARGQFGHNASVGLMSCNLGGDNVGDQLLA